MSPNKIRWFGLGLLVLVVLLCVVMHRPTIEGDLQGRSLSALGAAGLGEVAVAFRGRDARLSGALDSESQRSRAVATVADLRGVRVVRDQLTVAAPAAEATSAPRLAVQRLGARVVLQGRIPSEAVRLALRERARSIPGVQSIDDQLVVDREVEAADWLHRAPAMLARVPGALSDGWLRIERQELRYGGSMPTRDSARGLSRELAEAAGPGLELHDELRVRTPAAQPSPTPSATPATSGRGGAVAMADLERLLADLRLEFETNDSSLSPRGRERLDEVARLARSRPEWQLQVSGHTDGRGDAQRNLELSRRRAGAVRDYLIDRGLPAGRVTSVGHGSARPIADDATPEGRLRNRRIEIRLLEEHGP